MSVNVRKRSLVVDMLGFPWVLAVTVAITSDNEVSRLGVAQLKGKVLGLAVIAADHGYKVSFIEHIEKGMAGELRLHKSLKVVVN